MLRRVEYYHAHNRAAERLSLPDNADTDGWLIGLLEMIRDGKAKFIGFGRADDGKDQPLIYDVSSDTEVHRGTVRLLVNSEKNFVISVLPPAFRGQIGKQSKKDAQQAEGKRRRKHYRTLRIQGDDDDDFEFENYMASKA